MLAGLEVGRGKILFFQFFEVARLAAVAQLNAEWRVAS